MRDASSNAGSTSDRWSRATSYGRETSCALPRWPSRSGPVRPPRTGPRGSRPGATLHRPMRTPLVPLRVRGGRSGGVMLAFPDPAYPDSSYYVDVARALPADRAFTWTSSGSSPRWAAPLPADPVLPSPRTPTGCPSRRFVQAPVRGAAGADRVGLGPAVGADRFARGSTDLGDRPRRRRARRPSARRCRAGRDPGPDRPCTWSSRTTSPLFQPLVVGGPMDGGARPAWVRADRSPWPGSSSAWPRSSAMMACPARGARTRVRQGSLRAWRAGGARPALPIVGRGRLLSVCSSS